MKHAEQWMQDFGNGGLLVHLKVEDIRSIQSDAIIQGIIEAAIALDMCGREQFAAACDIKIKRLKENGVPPWTPVDWDKFEKDALSMRKEDTDSV